MNGNAWFANLALAALAAALPASHAAPQETHTVGLGVLEDLPGGHTGESDFRAVRAIFKKIGDDWQAFPTKTKSYLDLQTLPNSYPKEMKWTIAFDGRNLGRITSQTLQHFNFYSEIGIENITSRVRFRPLVGSH
jgi:hypothetical protein